MGGKLLVDGECFSGADIAIRNTRGNSGRPLLSAIQP